MKLLWLVLRPLLFLLDAEKAHRLTMGLFAMIVRIPGVRGLLRSSFAQHDPRLATSLAGLELPSPVGLGAGFDKRADTFDALFCLGFGFVEVGTLTAHAQPGNPLPRIFRLPADRALINRMGFNNQGSADAAAQLQGATVRGILGINIGKSKITPNDQAVDDYLLSFERLAPFAAYLTVNVSSPNTQGLRDLQAVDSLRSLLGALIERNLSFALERNSKPLPIFVKIAPDMTDEQAQDIVELAVELGLHGIIATNTTISRDGLSTAADKVQAIGAGGLSGAPLTLRSREFVATLYRVANGRLPIIGVGGIMNGDDAWEMLRAGASVIQVYTGFIYGGPSFVDAIHRRLVERLEAEGYDSISQVVGAAHR